MGKENDGGWGGLGVVMGIQANLHGLWVCLKIVFPLARVRNKKCYTCWVKCVKWLISS